jgi:phenylpropionate dioxygenase-like ring-hydroxylating dioxygenase large terminal subunit
MTAGMPAEPPNYPRDCWYVAATTDEVGRSPIGRTLLDTPVVLYRTDGGEVAALDDRCPHRGYPLSRGRLDGDLLVCGYHGFRFNATGKCVRVPSQRNVPYGACIRSYPVRERPPYVWIWLGDPRRSGLFPIPELPWLTDEGWTASGQTMLVAANYMLVHELHLDLTHTVELHPSETPAGIDELPPFDEVIISELSATYERQLPKAPLREWEADWTGLPRDRAYERRHYATFLSPAVLVDAWRIDGGADGAHEVARVQAVTPESPTNTRLFWQLAHDTPIDRERVSAHLHAALEPVTRRNLAVAEAVQAAVGYHGSRRGVNVTADAGALRIRRVVDRMLADEAGRPAPPGTMSTPG